MEEVKRKELEMLQQKKKIAETESKLKQQQVSERLVHESIHSFHDRHYMKQYVVTGTCTVNS